MELLMNIIRNLTLELQNKIHIDEIVLIIGARQVGKTTVLKQLKNFLEKNKYPCFYLTLEDPEYLSELNKSPKKIFELFTFESQQKNYLFIDEIQYLNNPTNFLKYMYDEYKKKIKIIASGSSAFYLDKKFTDSLAGRKKIYQLPTLSFKEFLTFKEQNNLSKKNFSQLKIAERDMLIPYFSEYIIYGGYPKVVLSPLSEKEQTLEDIAYSYIKKDVYESGLRQDEVFYRLFRMLANQIGNLINTFEISKTLGISKPTVDNYLYIMQKSFHIVLLRPFTNNLRKELTKMPKVYFQDIGLRNFFKKNYASFHQREDKGALLENAVWRQLSENISQQNIRFWRTQQKQEVDFIVNNDLALEVKTQLKNLKLSSYRAFTNAYPKIKLTFVTFNAEEKFLNNYPIKNVWEI